ncbi:MAG TPA: amidohydrolase [Polyangiales bacterium]|nr:amidohydrolase [Polyangiales bacterium]
MIRLAFLLLWLPAFALAQSAPSHAAEDAEVSRWIDQQLSGYLETYRGIHAHPELAFQEQQTSALVARELKRAGYTVSSGIGGYGVVGVLKNGPGKTLLLRGDMDALPVAEETGLAYASKVHAKDDTGQPVSVMHACGHDLHTTNLLATATFLAQRRATWSGTLLIVAQPAEEQGEGALRMINAGLFERFPRPDYALALHVDPDVMSGHVAIVSGWAAANSDAVDVTLYGRGGHGSRPQDAVDPIVLSAQYITALQTLVSRRNDPQQPAVITVGSIHGGTKRNVIPDSVQLLMTVRSYSDETRTKLLDGIKQLARDLSTAFGSPKPPDVKIKEAYTPAVWNDPNLAAEATKVFQSLLGPQGVEPGKVPMTAEDFGRFGKQLKIPSLLIRLGATPQAQYEASKKPGGTPAPGLHTSRFTPDAPTTLRTGVRALVALVSALLPPAAAAK